MRLLRDWPSGAVYTTAWLVQEKGYSTSLLHQYQLSGWIQSVGRGAYRRAKLDPSGNPQQNESPLKWEGGV